MPIPNEMYEELDLHNPTREDGSDIWELVKACAPLDENSMYCNIIQAEHFSQTCVVAKRGNKAVGWVSAYMKPGEEGTLFVWQVAVSKEARGCGLAQSMLEYILLNCGYDVRRLETTITLDNEASWSVFKKFANRRGGVLTSEPYFEREKHFDGRHKTEHLVCIDLSQSDQLAA